MSSNSERMFLGLHAVNVFVRDQDRSLRFYVDQLGFHVAFDARLQSGERWVAVAPPDGTAVLTLVAPAPDSKEYKLIGRPTGIILVTEDVIAKYDEWRRRGVLFGFTPRLRRVKRESEDESTVWGGVFTRFKDVDGNSFSLVGFDFITREIEAERRRVTEKLELERRATQEEKRHHMIPLQRFAQISHREDRKDQKGDDLLHGLELRRRIDLMADAVGGHGKAIFQKGNAPTDGDHPQQGSCGEFQLAVPRERHEDVGETEKKNWRDINPGHEKLLMKHIDCACFFRTQRGANCALALLFRRASAGDRLATFHYNFSTRPCFSDAPRRVKLIVGLVSVRRSTKRIQPPDGRTGFGAPHVKPFVRPSLFLSTLRSL